MATPAALRASGAPLGRGRVALRDALAAFS
jgi:hypothetical protein